MAPIFSVFQVGFAACTEPSATVPTELALSKPAKVNLVMPT